MGAHRNRQFARVASTLTAIVITLGDTAAWADPPKPPAPVTAPSGASPAPSAGAATAGAPNTVAGEEASVRFKRGLQLFDDGDYTLALVEFERAYQLAPNYRALYNIALVDIQLGRYADAVHTLEAYLRDGGDTLGAARRAEVTKKLNELKLRTATVDISMNTPTAEISLDGKPIDSARLTGPMLIDAGEHTLRVTAPGFAPKDRTLTLAGGDHVAVKFDLVSLAPNQPQPTEEAPLKKKPIFWPGFAVTGGLAAGAVVSGIVMLNAQSHLNSLKNQPSSDPNQRDSSSKLVNTSALVADVFTGLALVAGGVSLYMSLGTEHPQKARVAITPRSVLLEGSF
jgi:hypothetical protein